MSSRLRRSRLAALVSALAAGTVALALTGAPAGAAPTVGAPQTLHFSEWFAIGDSAAGITPKGIPYGAGGLGVPYLSVYSRALIWNGTTAVDITPGNLNYECQTQFASDAGVSAGYCENPTVWFVHSGSTTTLLPAGEVVEGIASNGVALIQYPDSGGTSLGLYSKGVLTRVSPPQPAGGTFWEGFAVNASGLVIGAKVFSAPISQDASGLYAFSGGTATVVDPTFSDGEAIMKLTDSGYFLYGIGFPGDRDLYHGTVTAGHWTGTHVPLAFPAGGSVGTVDDINESGGVGGVGRVADASRARAARWTATGALTFLSSVPSEAHGINAAGVAVGVTGALGFTGANGATIWTGTTELHPLPATKTAGAFWDISDTGRIVGWGPAGSDSVTWQFSG
jgi:hypothetical protein